MYHIMFFYHDHQTDPDGNRNKWIIMTYLFWNYWYFGFGRSNLTYVVDMVFLGLSLGLSDEVGVEDEVEGRRWRKR